MKKLIIFMILAVLVSSACALAVPAWKKQAPTPASKTPAAQPVQTQTTIIIQNITQAPKEEGMDWQTIGSIVGVLATLAAFIGWLLMKKGRSRASGYIKDISERFNKYKNDAGRCEAELYKMKEQIEHDFAKGKISEESFSMLDSRIDKYLSEVRQGIVTTFDLSPKTKKELKDMLEDGAISEEEYKKFSRLDISSLSKPEKARLERLMKKWRQRK